MMSNEGEEEGGVEVEGEDVGGSGDGGGVIVFYNNNKVNNKPASPSPSRTLPAVCAQCQDAEAKRAQMRAQYETEIARLKREAEAATKTKEGAVMKYATSEMEVLKLKKALENSEKLLKQARIEVDIANKKEKDLMKVFENEREALRQTHGEVLNDMSLCKAKEAELLAYTQQVTENSVALQANLSSLEAKNSVMKNECDRLRKSEEALEQTVKVLKEKLAERNDGELEAKRLIEEDLRNSKKTIRELQQKLDEARGEISILNRKLNSSVREFSKELHVARKQVKDGNSGSDGLSQSSRTSSSSSLANGDSTPSPSLPEKSNKSEDSSSHNESSDRECPLIPDQQVLIEKLVKLQKRLAKREDKLEFLQEHVKQLVESLQKKSKIIQAYAMSQDIEALSSNLAEQNRAEIIKHKGIMASVYGSKPADDGMTLDLSLEINRKLQVVLEDTLLRNITLKDSLNTLGKEISKLTEENQKLHQNL